MRLRPPARLFLALAQVSAAIGCSLLQDVDSVLCPKSNPTCQSDLSQASGGMTSEGGNGGSGDTGGTSIGGGAGDSGSTGGAPTLDPRCPEPGTVEALYFNDLVQGAELASARIRPYFQIKNNGDEDLDVSLLRLRYYLSEDDARLSGYSCATAFGSQSGECSGKVEGHILQGTEPGATEILELTFSEGLELVRPGDETTDINGSILTQASDELDQSNDYSYSEAEQYVTDRNVYSSWDKVTLHCGDSLLWGTPPGG